MRIRAVVIHLCLSLSSAMVLCPKAGAQQVPLPVPPFDVRITASQAAEAMLNSPSEKITIHVAYFGYARPDAKVFADGAGRVTVGSSTLEVPAHSQDVQIPASTGDKSRLEAIRSPLRLFIIVQTADLSCENFEGPAKDVARESPVLHCWLSGEKTNGLFAVPKSQAANSCAIYDLLLPGASSDKLAPSQIQRWYLSDTTVNIHDMEPSVPPDGQLKPPPDNVVAFNQALQEFRSREQERVEIDPSCFQNSGLTLIDQRQVYNFRNTVGTGTGITFFSAVYFNDDQNAALVYVNDWCANLCSAGQWVYLEKQGGQWARRSGIVTGGA